MTADFREIGRRLSNWGRWDADGHKDEFDAVLAAQGVELQRRHPRHPHRLAAHVPHRARPGLVHGR